MKFRISAETISYQFKIFEKHMQVHRTCTQEFFKKKLIGRQQLNRLIPTPAKMYINFFVCEEIAEFFLFLFFFFFPLFLLFVKLMCDAKYCIIGSRITAYQWYGWKHIKDYAVNRIRRLWDRWRHCNWTDRPFRLVESTTWTRPSCVNSVVGAAEMWLAVIEVVWLERIGFLCWSFRWYCHW